MEKIIAILQSLPYQSVYLYGSRIYGTSENRSDYDILAIGTEDTTQKRQIDGFDLDIEVVTLARFQANVTAMKAKYIEAIHSPVKVERVALTKPSIETSATGFVEKASKSFKLLEKLQYESPIKYRKGLFHVLRLLEFSRRFSHGDTDMTMDTLWNEKFVYEWTFSEEFMDWYNTQLKQYNFNEVQ